MLHEARDRQKFVSDVQYLRDMQHKVDSEYQACLRRQEHRKDPNEKKRDHFWGLESSSERSRFSSGSSSKQSSNEEDPHTEPRSPVKTSSSKCDSRLPAIDQTSVKQKHKSTMTMTLRQTDKVVPSKPSSAQAPKILSKKRRPNLERLAISPELHSPRASGDKSRQKPQLPAKAPALRGADPAVQQEGPMWAGDTKLKRPTRERRNLVPSSQLVMTDSPPERASKKDLSPLSQSETHSTLSQAFQGTNSPQVLSKSLGPPLTPTNVGGPRRAPFRFRDEDFYSILSLNTGRENDDTEEETHMEEELLVVGMHSPRSPSNPVRSRFWGTSATQAKNKAFEESAEKNGRDNSLRRCEPNHGSLRIGNAMEPVTKPPSVVQKLFQDSELLPGKSAKENDSSGRENKTFPSWDPKSKPRQDDGLNAENISSDCISMEDRAGAHDYERDWQDYLNSSRNSLDCFLSDRPIAPRSSMNSFNTPASLTHVPLRNDIPGDLSMSSTLVHSSDSEGNPRFNIRRPLSPIRNRNSFANTENHNYFPVNSTPEFDVGGAEDITLRSRLQRAPLYPDDFLLNPQSNLSLVNSSNSSPPGMSIQAHLHVPGSLQENIPFTFFAVSDFPNQNDHGNIMASFGYTDGQETTKIKTDPVKLKKLQESLLEEDSEEEGDLCRICQIAGGSPSNPLLEPCGCVGSLKFVHQECLKKWLKVKITSGADLGTVKTCEMCKQSLLVDLDDFNMTDFYQKHQQSQAQNELMNSGLYLVLLLHLYEQRFAEFTRLNYSWFARERVLSWEMERKAAFLKAGSSSKRAGCGAQQRPLDAAIPFMSPCAHLPPSLY
ncbi:probable E3 ubiquitin-protein ligase MARCHF10 isoform X2 [Nycticebus coucang]|uniref:probable E3 ubiquitin-protein ligase MARCHF10 isoform X2 n=1 Tax=Nycticebus coucang TaxID=9470 RepID=UPI00234C95AA|nr:probable E3 ubiquitin-protein ligase MARCHF10 isoform X2 [Nycticebus coucang]